MGVQVFIQEYHMKLEWVARFKADPPDANSTTDTDTHPHEGWYI